MEKTVILDSEGREWGVGSVVVRFGVLGRPDFQPRGPRLGSFVSLIVAEKKALFLDGVVSIQGNYGELGDWHENCPYFPHQQLIGYDSAPAHCQGQQLQLKRTPDATTSRR